MIVKVFTLARVAKLADARDLKSRVPKGTYRFDSGPGHQVSFEIPRCAHARKAPQLKIRVPKEPVLSN